MGNVYLISEERECNKFFFFFFFFTCELQCTSKDRCAL